jgi:hypothetical protein
MGFQHASHPRHRCVSRLRHRRVLSAAHHRIGYHYRGGLTPSARILRPQAASAFFGAILAVIALIAMGIVTIFRLIRGMVRSGPPVSNSSLPPPNSLKTPQ